MNKAFHRTGAVLACALMVFAFAGEVLPAAAHDMNHDMPSAAMPLADDSLYNLESKWTSEDGKAITLSDLRGHTVVMAMAYTSCKDMCPAIIADMLWIEASASRQGTEDVKYIFVSLDPDIDTPAHLKDYAREHGLNPAHWTLLSGAKDDIRELAAAIGLRYRRNEDGSFDHSNLITLLDTQGRIAFQQAGTQANSAEFVKKLRMESAIRP